MYSAFGSSASAQASICSVDAPISRQSRESCDGLKVEAAVWPPHSSGSGGSTGRAATAGTLALAATGAGAVLNASAPGVVDAAAAESTWCAAASCCPATPPKIEESSSSPSSSLGLSSPLSSACKGSSPPPSAAPNSSESPLPSSPAVRPAPPTDTWSSVRFFQEPMAARSHSTSLCSHHTLAAWHITGNLRGRTGSQPAKFSSTLASSAFIISSASASIAAFCASTLASNRARSCANCSAVLPAGFRFALGFGLLANRTDSFVSGQPTVGRMLSPPLTSLSLCLSKRPE